jgi:tRNA(Phe) wybutosine-synthesizing methylase Tyw3
MELFKDTLVDWALAAVFMVIEEILHVACRNRTAFHQLLEYAQKNAIYRLIGLTCEFAEENVTATSTS